MKSRTHKASDRQTWRWHLYVVFMTIVVGLFLAWLSNKLLMEEVIKRATTRIYAPLLSLNYPDIGQRAIAVMTLDDTDLKEYGLNWPVPLDYYQRLLDGVVKRKPKAVFLDVLFLDDKPKKEVESLIDAACRATDAGIPFFLATFALEPLTSNTERQIFAARSGSGVPCVIPVRPNVTPDSLDQSQWAYPLRPRNADEDKENSSLPDSVALTIYCKLYPGTCPAETDVPLALIWATRAASTNVSTMVVRDKQGSLIPVCRDVWNWWEVIPGTVLFRQIANMSMLPLCPYNQVIPVRAFKKYGFTVEQLDEELKGKVVLIGADLKAIGDNLFSPLHGRLPGVHVHAMALDNLISFKGKYRENGDFEWRELWHSSANIFIFLSLLLTALMMVPWNHHKEAVLARKSPRKAGSCSPSSCRNRARIFMILCSPFMLILGGLIVGRKKKTISQWMLPIIHVLIYLILGVAIFYLGYYVFFQGPLAIIEYVMFPVMAHFLHIGETIANRSKQLWYAMSAPDPWAHWALIENKYT
ncbi:CHASE2 domain-containing protein [Polaromonas sp.]|uniref:CHASE2 domain-containing protein n=1 Tax=Polaromonas sp. TaxID=1869339 RepID=UPI0017EB88A9|nr:CHASE2 domain-containing protein [Polaromonas sp.]NMM06827.1 CHASE2 domain-containing protein [Polaromonas sp.]